MNSSGHLFGVCVCVCLHRKITFFLITFFLPTFSLLVSFHLLCFLLCFFVVPFSNRDSTHHVLILIYLNVDSIEIHHKKSEWRLLSTIQSILIYSWSYSRAARAFSPVS